jgi:eukaryotic-like serine/threonine-protein kinase
MAYPEPRLPIASVSNLTGSNPDNDPLVGTLLADRYRLFSLLGEGGMGRVYFGEHALMHKRVAVKILHRELTQVAEVVARFEREAMAAANIDHPNVAGATDFGKLPDGSVFLVLEYVQGRSLRELIAEGHLPVERALHIARQIASALTSAHAFGIVHRDLKPENVMLVEKNGDPDFVKVLDFGIAKVPVQEVSERGSIRPGKVITRVGMIFGTPEYMAPEQALGQNVDARADLYTLGIILFEMLSGRRPFSADNPIGILGQQLQGPLPTFAKRAPHVQIPPALEQLVLRLLAPMVGLRFQCAEDLHTALEALQVQLAFKANTSAHRASLASAQWGRVSRPLIDSRTESAESGLIVPSQNLSVGTEIDDPLNASTLPAPEYNPKSTKQSQDTPRRLVSAMRGALRSRRGRLFLGGIAGTLASVLLVAVFWAARPKPQPLPAASRVAVEPPPSTAPTPSAAVTSAPEVQIAQARESGPATLEQLAASYPKDIAVWVELARARLAAGNASAALDAAKDAYLADPAANKDARLATVLWKTAQKRDTSEKTLNLLGVGFGDRGVDILYDLTTTPGVRRDVKKAAASALYTTAAQDAASPALKVLLALEHTTSCEEKLALLARAESDADSRSLPLLTAMRSTVGCGKRRRHDCYPCLRQGPQLDNTIAAVRQRNGT